MLERKCNTHIVSGSIYIDTNGITIMENIMELPQNIKNITTIVFTSGYMSKENEMCYLKEIFISPCSRCIIHNSQDMALSVCPPTDERIKKHNFIHTQRNAIQP